MLSDTTLRVDDLSPEEIASVLRAYEDGIGCADHDDAFDRAVDALRAIRPQLPANIAGSEVELLLAGAVVPFAPTAVAAAPYVFCE
ncbi:hypothetical protein [Azospirillum sp. SYSU D00513]|uniref:hypothetical protein n=1 Tax=Azospirillum sp. SYSU D00513 TaxID=2812561 RepID=UPI001A96B042|nr:hypothetical protein [Azospirillum sp. SYSU D00513]